MKHRFVITLLTSIGALPPSCTEGDEVCAAAPVKGSAMLQIRGATNHLVTTPKEDPAMVWLEVDGDLAREALKEKESKHILKVLEDAKKYVTSQEGEDAAKDLDKAIEAVKLLGPEAVAADEELKKIAEDALDLVSQEMDADTAQKSGDVVTLEDEMAIEGETDNPEVSADPLCIEGDMCATDNASFALLQARHDAGYRTAINLYDKDKPIKVCTYGKIDDKTMAVWQEALQQFRNLVPCKALQFEEVKAGKGCNIMMYSQKPGCSAGIGVTGSGKNPTGVNLGNGCAFVGVAAHELGHALGMFHEQAREDRDDAIKVLWDNIKAEGKGQYGKNTGDPDYATADPYDIGSLMHYARTTFTSNGKNTMDYQKGVTKKTMGNRMGLSGADAKQLARMYGCIDDVNWKLCPDSKDECVTDECICHQDETKDVYAKEKDKKGCYRCVKQKKIKR